MQKVIAMFGESEKGKYHVPYVFHSLEQLSNTLGEPPKDSFGLFYAIQALMYEREVIYFRVEDEGYSVEDYMIGLKFLKKKKSIKRLDALCMPKVGSKEIIDATNPICLKFQSLIIINENDLFDYLLSKPF
ncbi:MAG: hypothetical protein K1060chlam5_01305 [Candidatus Anoxychlamydiales bacterium]|nr:hypothetical protein [Candidatus Anoxychlamydiales bacterium]